MKKMTALLLVALMLLLMTACGGNSNSDSTYDYNVSGYSSGSATSSGSGFTNQYGDKDTKCAVTGCDNTIARSGDTNCCTTHSNRCLECNCYIDGDAMYCMDCLSSALTDDSDDYSSYQDYDTDFDDDYDYDYDMPEEGESFSDYVQRVDPDLYNEMEEIFNSLS